MQCMNQYVYLCIIAYVHILIFFGVPFGLWNHIDGAQSC